MFCCACGKALKRKEVVALTRDGDVVHKSCLRLRGGAQTTPKKKGILTRFEGILRRFHVRRTAMTVRLIQLAIGVPFGATLYLRDQKQDWLDNTQDCVFAREFGRDAFKIRTKFRGHPRVYVRETKREIKRLQQALKKCSAEAELKGGSRDSELSLLPAILLIVFFVFKIQNILNDPERKRAKREYLHCRKHLEKDNMRDNIWAGLWNEKRELLRKLNVCSARQRKNWKDYYDDTSVQSDDIESESESSILSNDEESFSTANESGNGRGGICRANERSGGDQQDYTRAAGYACSTPYRKEFKSLKNRRQSCEKKTRDQVGGDTRLFANLQQCTDRCYYE